MRFSLQKYTTLIISLAYLLLLAGCEMTVKVSYENPDKTAPMVLSTSPGINEENVPINKNIEVVFNEAIDDDAIDDTSLIVLDSDNNKVQGSVSYEPALKKIIFTPGESYKYNMTYTVKLSKSIKDLGGNSIRVTFSWEFTTGAIISPEIDISCGGSVVPNGTHVFDFGSILINGTSPSAAFSIMNIGSNNLVVSNISITGGDISQFDLNTSSVPLKISAGSATDFTLKFKPTSIGNKSAIITVTSNDLDEGTYTFIVKGTSVAVPKPEIVINKGVTEITSGSAGHLFGNILTGEQSSEITFTIKNIGEGDLAISTISKGGTNPDQFVLNTSATDMNLANNESTTLTVAFSPSSVGTKNTVISIVNNDMDEGLYTFSVSGTASLVSKPHIAVSKSGTAITSGSLAHDFGERIINGSSESRTIVIQNIGGTDLVMSGISISQSESNQYSIITTSTSMTVTPGQNTSFTVKFKPTTTGAKSATVTISSNDTDKPTFTFSLAGTGKIGPEPAIQIYDGSTELKNLNGSVSFETILVGQETAEKIVTLKNPGTGDLYISNIYISGDNPEQFILNTTGTNMTIPVGGSTIMTVKFKPLSIGGKPAEIRINSNAKNASIFTFRVWGNGDTVWKEQSVNGFLTRCRWESVTTSADGSLIAGVISDGYIAISRDSGTTWALQKSIGPKQWSAIASTPDGIKLVALGSTMYFSNDSGVTWTEQSSLGYASYWTGLAISSDGTIIAACSTRGVRISIDSGVTWKSFFSDSGYTFSSIAMSANGDKIAVTNNELIFISNDHGTNWENPFMGMGWGALRFQSVTISSDGSKIYTVADSDSTYAPGYFFKSQDGGKTWTNTPSWKKCVQVVSSSDGNKLVAAVDSGSIYTSTDAGSNWSEHTFSGLYTWSSLASSADGTKLVASVYNGNIFTSKNSGALWTEFSDYGMRKWSSIASSTDGMKLAATTSDGHVYTTTNGGATWLEHFDPRLAYCEPIVSSADGNKLATAVTGGYVYTSTDSGKTWTENNVIGKKEWSSVASSSDGVKLFAAAFKDYLYTSHDSGATWSQFQSAGSKFWQTIRCSEDGSKIIAIASNGYISISTDSGSTWSEQQPGGGTYKWSNAAMSADGTKIAITASQNIQRISYDGGLSWTSPFLNINGTIKGVSFSADGSKIGIAADNGNIFTSIDGGVKWSMRSFAGIRPWTAIVVVPNGSKIFALATSDNGVFAGEL